MKNAAFSLIEILIALTILLVIAGVLVRVLYHEQLRSADTWFAETFGFSPWSIVGPALFLYVIFRVTVDRKRRPRNRRFIHPRD